MFSNNISHIYIKYTNKKYSLLNRRFVLFTFCDQANLAYSI